MKRFTIAEGNKCLFIMFALFNFLAFLSSLGLLGCSFWLFYFTKTANVFNVGFLVVGVVLLVFSLIAFKLRTSIHLLLCYLLFMIVVNVFEFSITILTFTNPDTLINIAKSVSTETSQIL